MAYNQLAERLYDISLGCKKDRCGTFHQSNSGYIKLYLLIYHNDTYFTEFTLDKAL